VLDLHVVVDGWWMFGGGGDCEQTILVDNARVNNFRLSGKSAK
jgi:hypothetical protein